MSDPVSQLLDRGRKNKKVKLNAFHWCIEKEISNKALEKYVFSFKKLAKYASLDNSAKTAAWFLLDYVTEQLAKNAADKENRTVNSLHPVSNHPEFPSGN